MSKPSKSWSVAELGTSAKDSLKHYCSPGSNNAWPWYDLDLSPDRLLPTDLLAPAMLSYPIPTKVLQQLLSDKASEYRTLREALELVVADDQARTTTFADLPADSLRDRSAPGWGTVLRALDAVQKCDHLTSVAVTKILHRKRPNLVPIVDSRLRSFYGVSGMGYAALFDRIHEDLRLNGQLVEELRGDYRLENGNPMSALRALDIVAWMANK